MSSEVKMITGTGIPVVGNDIDTDRIIPARFLRCVTFDGLGQQVFVDDRAQANGQHPFDQPQYQGATVLVVNGNFGCGSSREHAPQAIARWGIQGIVGESFAEIFFGNCLAMGLPCVTADSETVKQLQTSLHQNPEIPMTLDLEEMQVYCGELQASVFMEDGPRNMLLTGTWDTCGQLVAQVEAIRATAARLPYMDWGVVS
ncbi:MULTISPECIES: 3-isopropylmalate dehydratase small subunit [Moorena]|uniref:3-isopropylmalate dehydratase small subunit n=2 Tax=Moorena TaxID=1155738 RepID=A0A1U7MYJ0_9CYAN|nr:MULTISPECIES: 3-isopropylmalate dehydratase small subunit [Moorena]NEO14213.1 3-isopropylmalate dehydratase small subunit [Moorena sp. SIO3E8]NEQ00978.1 3-isopropylmalate dehydratase small subunit [Moorena sp. SIO3F7]OLT58749.1 3-isopropylmalate dehydratase small subunit [Moorena bouillonii PNG]